MAKPLREPVPSSSVSRLFDMAAAARAVATVPGETAPVSAIDATAKPPLVKPPRRSSGDRPTLKREFLLTPSGNRTFEDLWDLYRRTTQTRLTASHLLRSILKAVAHGFEQLEREAKRIGPLKLPHNARGNEEERERFEARIADAFVAGIRSAPGFGTDGE